MAKGNKSSVGGGGPSGKAPEAVMRMNYLYQAANVVAKNSTGEEETKKSAFSRRVMSTHMTHLMLAVGRKSTTRASPAIKRTVCKACHLTLKPGQYAEVSVSTNKGSNKKLRLRCKQCGASRQFPKGSE